MYSSSAYAGNSSANNAVDQPKQIYRCDFAGCDREFVRADLRARHKERHTAKGSHLQRKDAFLNSHRSVVEQSGDASPEESRSVNGSPVQVSHVFQAKSTSDGYYTEAGAAHTAMAYTNGPPEQQRNYHSVPEMTPYSNSADAPLDPQLSTYNAYTTPYNAPPPPPQQHPSPDGRRFSFDGMFSARPASAVNNYINAPPGMSQMQPPPISSPPSAPPTAYTQQSYPSPASSNRTFQSPTTYSMLPSLPPFGYPQGYTYPVSRSGSVMPQASMGMSQHPAPNSVISSMADFNAMDQLASGYAMPVFGYEMYNRSPSAALDENLLTMLFDTNGVEISDPSPPEPDPTPQTNVPLPKVEPDGSKHEITAPSLSDGLDITLRESTISDQKQRRLWDYISNFSEIEHSPGQKLKKDILAGDTDDPNHPMSLPMLKTYLTSYWVHMHHQMPILHRPTFNPDTCPDLLLLAMMCLGATCLERTHSVELTKRGAEWAFFVAYHVRWEVFKVSFEMKLCPASRRDRYKARMTRADF